MDGSRGWVYPVAGASRLSSRSWVGSETNKAALSRGPFGLLVRMTGESGVDSWYPIGRVQAASGSEAAMVMDGRGGGGAVAAETPLAARGPGRPPSSDRGVATLNGVVGRFSTSVDFLTITLGSGQVADLLAETVVSEAGHAVRGFGRSERRECLGGLCWRRWEPSQAASGFGHDYESWQFSGASSSVYAGRLAGRGRPSRVDVAFDFVCDRRLYVRRFFRRIRSLVRPRVVPEWSEKGDDATCYLGARSSDWRIAIYRKDVQQGPLWDEAFPPVLRIEARMGGDLARDFWAAWSREAAAGFSMVAGRVESWLGVSVADEQSEWVEVVKPEEFDPAQRLLAFFEQNGAVLDECRRAGVPVFELAAIASGRRCRVSRWRSEARLRQLVAVGVPGVVELVRRALLGPSPSGG